AELPSEGDYRHQPKDEKGRRAAVRQAARAASQPFGATAVETKEAPRSGGSAPAGARPSTAEADARIGRRSVEAPVAFLILRLPTRDSRAISSNATGGAACGGPWPRSAGSVRG